MRNWINLFENILLEAKQVIDLRHEPSDLKFYGAKNSDYISPEDGFHFVFYDGILIVHSTNNPFYDFEVVNNDPKSPDKRIVSTSWNQFGGMVNLKARTITISKEAMDKSYRQRTIATTKEIRSALLNLSPYGVTPDFIVKGTPSHIPKTVADIINLKDQGDIILAGLANITMYHGTTEKRWKDIEVKGLLPGLANRKYNDLIAGHSDHNVYLCTTIKNAEFYAKRLSQIDGTKPVILKVVVPDPAKIVADDRNVSQWPTADGLKPDADELYRRSQTAGAIKSSTRELGEFGYRGNIKPHFITRIR